MHLLDLLDLGPENTLPGATVGQVVPGFHLRRVVLGGSMRFPVWAAHVELLGNEAEPLPQQYYICGPLKPLHNL